MTHDLIRDALAIAGALTFAGSLWTLTKCAAWAVQLRSDYRRAENARFEARKRRVGRGAI